MQFILRFAEIAFGAQCDGFRFCNGDLLDFDLSGIRRKLKVQRDKIFSPSGGQGEDQLLKFRLSLNGKIGKVTDSFVVFAPAHAQSGIFFCFQHQDQRIVRGECSFEFRTEADHSPQEQLNTGFFPFQNQHIVFLTEGGAVCSVNADFPFFRHQGTCVQSQNCKCGGCAKGERAIHISRSPESVELIYGCCNTSRWNCFFRLP